MEDPLPGDHLADWQLWLGTTVFSWLPFAFEMLALAFPLAAIAWAVTGGLQHYWIASLKIGGGFVASWALWRFADFVHPIALDFFNTFYVVREHRQRAKDTRGYFLFLRSFRDAAFAVRQTVAVTGTDGRTTTITIDNLSELLEQGLEKYGRFIMIGHEPTADPFRDASAMARTDDANWWSVFTRLLSNARCAFLVPEASAGLLREFTEVLNGPHRSKAIIVMPRMDAQGLRAGRWESLRADLAQKGFALPPYDPAGCFYMPDAQLRPVSTFSFGVSPSMPRGMRRAFRKIDAMLPRGTTPYNEALTWIDLADGQFPVNLSEVVNRQ